MLRVKAIATPLTVVLCLCLIRQVAAAEEPSLVCTEADEDAIYRLGLDTMHLTPLHVTERDLSPIAIRYHDGSLYWTDVGALHVASLNGSDYRTLVTFPRATTSRGVAVDPESGRVFYTLAGDNAAIAVLDLPDYTETVLVSSGLGQPHAIALHPDLRVVFWTDSGDSPRIERVDYDGNGRKAIVTTTIASTFGLAVDLHNQLLFWTNSGGEISRIERSDLLGNGRQVIFSRPAAGSQLAALAFYNDQLLVSDLLTREILLLNATGVQITQVDIPLGRFQDIDVIGTDYTSPEAEEPSLVCTEADEGAIYRLGLDTMHLTPLHVTERDLSPITIHYHDGSLYWTDVGALHVASLNGSDYRTLVTFPPATTSRGVAVDPESGRVFYTLAGDNAAIAVLDLPDYTETVLVSSGLGQPHAIALHPDLRVVFWTDSGDSPRIERVDYDGNGRKAIVTTTIASTFGLAVDLHNQLLFWTNSGGEISRIERSDLLGNGRQVIFSRPAAGSQLAALAFYNDQLLVSDLLTREILLLNATGVQITQVDIPLGRFQDIDVIGTDYTSPEAPEEPSLVCTEADEGAIYRLGLDTMHLTPLHVTEGDLPPIAIYYHDGSLYWTDVGALHVASLNGSDYRTLVTFPPATTSRGVAVDPESGRVFYTLAGDNAAIAVLDLPDYTETVLVSSGLGQPHAIALHPDLRVVFWTDSGDSPRIERVDYDGNGRKAIVTTTIASTFGLAVDLHNQLLFWTNSGGEISRIERSDLLGNGRQVIFSRPAAGSQLAALAFYNDQLLVSDLLTREILLLNATGVQITQVDIPLGRFQDIYVIGTNHTSPEGGQRSISRLDSSGSGDVGAAVGGAMAALAAVAAASGIIYSKFKKKRSSVSPQESTEKDKVENGDENDHVIPEMLNGPASQTQPLDTRLPARLPPLVIPAMMGGAGSKIQPLDTRLPAPLPPIRR